MRYFAKKKGMGLAAVIAAIFAVFIMATGIVTIGIQGIRESNYQSWDDLALRAAQGGTLYTLSKLNSLFKTSGPPLGSPWLGYGNRICELTRNDVACSPACIGSFGTNGIFGTNVSAPWIQNLDSAKASFKTYYYSNMFDCSGNAIDRTTPNPVDPSKPGFLTILNDPQVGRIDVPPSDIAIVSVGIANTGAIGGGVVKKTLTFAGWKSGSKFILGNGGDISSYALSGHLSTDSYKSDFGYYCAQCPGSCGGNGKPNGTPCQYNGDIGTNDSANPAIMLTGSSQINGTAVVGIGGSVGGATSTNPTGGWIQCNHCIDTTLATLPSLLNATSSNVPGCPGAAPCNPTSPTFGTSCSNPLRSGYNYGNLTVNLGERMYLQPGKYTFSSITLSNNANLYMCLNTNPPYSPSSPSTAPAVIYLANNLITPIPSPQLILGNNSVIAVVLPTPGNQTPTTDTNKAPQLLILGNANFNSVDFSAGNGTYTMALHAPAASYTGPGFGTVEVFGSIVVNALPAKTTSTIKFHFDESLGRTFSGNPLLTPTFVIVAGH